MVDLGHDDRKVYTPVGPESNYTDPACDYSLGVRRGDCRRGPFPSNKRYYPNRRFEEDPPGYRVKIRQVAYFWYYALKMYPKVRLRDIRAWDGYYELSRKMTPSEFGVMIADWMSRAWHDEPKYILYKWIQAECADNHHIDEVVKEGLLQLAEQLEITEGTQFHSI